MYAWLRLYSETLHDRKLLYAAEQAKVPRALVLGVWTTLLCLANDSPQRGRLLLAEALPIDGGMLSQETGLDESTLTVILNAFERVGMISRVDFVIALPNWDTRQFQSDYSSERVKRWRETHMQRSDETLQERYHNTPDTDTDTEQIRTDVCERAQEKPLTPDPKLAPLVIYSEITKRYLPPDDERRAMILKAVPVEGQDLERWRYAVTCWKASGYKADNVTGILNWFANGVPENKRPPRQGGPGPPTTPAERYERQKFDRELEAWNARYRASATRQNESDPVPSGVGRGNATTGQSGP